MGNKISNIAYQYNTNEFNIITKEGMFNINSRLGYKELNYILNSYYICTHDIYIDGRKTQINNFDKFKEYLKICKNIDLTDEKYYVELEDDIYNISDRNEMKLALTLSSYNKIEFDNYYNNNKVDGFGDYEYTTRHLLHLFMCSNMKNFGFSHQITTLRIFNF
jgi:hypothetical protein